MEEVSISVKHNPIPWPCSACIRADCKNCTAVKLMSVKTESGAKLLNDPAYHCSCYRKNQEIHESFIRNVKPKDLVHPLWSKEQEAKQEQELLAGERKFDKIYNVDEDSSHLQA